MLQVNYNCGVVPFERRSSGSSIASSTESSSTSTPYNNTNNGNGELTLGEVTYNNNNNNCQQLSKMSRQLLANTVQQNLTNENFDSKSPNHHDWLDDSLTNLNWLHNVNPVKINEQINLSSTSTSHYFVKDKQQQHKTRYNFSTQNPVTMTNNVNNAALVGGVLPAPLIHSLPIQDISQYKFNPNYKPPFSYAVLIAWAMQDIGKSKITLSDIYNWIMDNFAYYRHSDNSWQNSVRHNLSLGKCFEKVPRRKDEKGKGGFWRLNAAYSKALIDVSYPKYASTILESNDNNNNNNNLLSLASAVRYPDTSTTTIINSSSISNNNNIKKSRKSPLMVTPEHWDANTTNTTTSSSSKFPFKSSQLQINKEQQHSSDINRTFNDNSSSSDSTFYSLGTPNEFDMGDNNNNNNNNVNFDRIILHSPPLMLHDDAAKSSSDDLEIEQSVTAYYSNELNEIFSPKDDLQDLSYMLGI